MFHNFSLFFVSENASIVLDVQCKWNEVDNLLLNWSRVSHCEKGCLTTILFFVDTPSFAITRTPGFGYPLREGIPVSLKCDVDSNPPSSAMWQKDDGDPPVSDQILRMPKLNYL